MANLKTLDIKNNIFIGPQKTGTSLIYDYLEYCSLSRTNIKETFYFELNKKPKLKNYYKKFSNIDQYMSEVSPSYFSSEEARKNILNLLPESNIIINFRKPRNLIKSYLIHLYSIGKIRSNDFLSIDLSSSIDLKPISYDFYLPKWEKDFKNIYFLKFEDFIDSPEYRFKIFLSLFPKNYIEKMKYITLDKSNESFSYSFNLFRSIRSFTPLINKIPFSNQIIKTKSFVAAMLPKKKYLPSVNLEMPRIKNYIDSQEKYLKQRLIYES